MALKCINQKILHVDLSQNKTWVEEPPESFYRKYGGGSGMGLYYILKEMPARVDALSPENILTLFSGLATGLPVSGQSRLNANAKSPLTGGIGDSQCGGFFPAKLKNAGFDGIVIRGKAAKPVYLWIHDGQVEIRDAKHLWGKLVAESDSLIKSELKDDKVETMLIGPAGEKLSRIACLMNMCNRANGRTGMGAVMGSKNLKGVVVQGNKKLSAADADGLSKMFKDGTKRIDDIPDVKGLGLNGTADVVAWQNSVGTLPTRNYGEGQFEGFGTLTGDTLTSTMLKERDTCFSCTVRCKRVVETEYKGRVFNRIYGGPEYETIATFGSYCGNDNLSAVSIAHELCDAYGLDTISAGATIAFAMECFEKGLITKKDTGGIELKFGNADAMLQMLEMIGKREGFGNVLAEGSARAAKVIGNGAEDLLASTKGQEAPAHMPQVKKSLGVIYAVNPFGADHQSSEHDPIYEEGANPLFLERLAMLGLKDPQAPFSMNMEKVKFTYKSQLVYSVTDVLELCQFVWGPGWQLYGPGDMVDLVKVATGWDFTLDEMVALGERRLNMLRTFNAREGFTRKDDVLSKKFSKPLQGTGPSAGVIVDPVELESYKDYYYELAGWDKSTGNPSKAKLASLDLEWVNI